MNPTMGKLVPSEATDEWVERIVQLRLERADLKPQHSSLIWPRMRDSARRHIEDVLSTAPVVEPEGEKVE